MRNAFAALAPRVSVFLLLFCVCIAHSHAAQRQEVTFAGIAYTGAVENASRALPVSSAALRGRENELNQRLSGALSKRPPPAFELVLSGLASLDGSGSSIVMAVALDRETITSEPIAGQYKVLFELAGQLLFFDFRERQVLFAYPVTLQRITVLPAPPTQAEIAAAADQLLFGTSASSLVTVLPDEVAGLSLPTSSSRRIQLTEVRLAPELTGKIRREDPELVGHEFTKVLASGLRLPMLPHAAGQAIGGAMATRFADGTAYTLKIPEPDYRIVLDVRDFRQKTLTETPAFRRQLYGAFFNVRVEEPLSSTVYFDQSLRQGSTTDIPSSQGEVDTAAAYYETLLAGFSSLSQAIGGRGEAWAGEQTGGRDFARQLKSLKELIAKCR